MAIVLALATSWLNASPRLKGLTRADPAGRSRLRA